MGGLTGMKEGTPERSEAAVKPEEMEWQDSQRCELSQKRWTTKRGVYENQ